MSATAHCRLGSTEPQPDRTGIEATVPDRVGRLLEAVRAVGSDLDLPVVLRHIVEAAVTLVEASYGALGVIDEQGDGLSEFITVGIDAAAVAAIGAPPTGRGVLGELVRTPAPLRLTDLADHPASVGFPPNHPPMRLSGRTGAGGEHRVRQPVPDEQGA